VYIQGLYFGIFLCTFTAQRIFSAIWPALVTEKSVESVRMEFGDVLFCHPNT